MQRGNVSISRFRGVCKDDVSAERKELLHNGTCCSVRQLKWNPPVGGTIYGTLFNYQGVLDKYRSNFIEPPYIELPKAPVLYIKSNNTIIGYGAPIPLPDGIPEIEVGASLGVVIGRTATRVCEDKAFEYVTGYTIVNDVSIPHESFFRPAVKQKCRDGFCPIGPWVVERDAVSDPGTLGIRVFINGKLQQENTTENLIRPVSRLIAEVTDFMTLYKGDLLLVGVPEGAPLAKAGDHIRIEIDHLGFLENPVVLESELYSGGEFV